jgi:hypothetical protein
MKVELELKERSLAAAVAVAVDGEHVVNIFWRKIYITK